MALRVEDELDEDNTLHKISEVTKKVADEDDDIEHPVTQPDEVTLVLIEEARKFGVRFQSLNKEIDVCVLPSSL